MDFVPDVEFSDSTPAATKKEKVSRNILTVILGVMAMTIVILAALL